MSVCRHAFVPTNRAADSLTGTYVRSAGLTNEGGRKSKTSDKTPSERARETCQQRRRGLSGRSLARPARRDVPGTAGDDADLNRSPLRRERERYSAGQGYELQY
jgi:hypothetical protein